MRFSLVFLFILVLASVSSQLAIPDYVNDYAGILSPDEIDAISLVAQEVQQQGVEFAIVTTPSLEGQDIESYSIEIAQGHLGDPKLDNGLLLLIAPNERKYRFEVGSGIEGTFNDAKIGRIGRDYLVPAFKQEEYGVGILDVSNAILAELNGEVAPAPPQQLSNVKLKLIIFIIIVFILLIIITSIRKKNSYFNAASSAAWYFGGGGGSGGSGGGFGGGGFSGGGSSGGW